MYHNIINCEPDYNHPNMSMAAKDIIHQLLNKDPNLRPKVSQAKAHTFFKVIDFNCLLKKEVTPPFIPDCSNTLAYVSKEFLDEDVVDSSSGNESVDCCYENFAFGAQSSEYEEGVKASLVK